MYEVLHFLHSYQTFKRHHHLGVRHQLQQLTKVTSMRLCYGVHNLVTCTYTYNISRL